MSEREEEALREKLLYAMYAGSLVGMPLFLDKDRIETASYEELKEIAKEYGY